MPNGELDDWEKGYQETGASLQIAACATTGARRGYTVNCPLLPEPITERDTVGSPPQRY